MPGSQPGNKLPSSKWQRQRLATLDLIPNDFALCPGQYRQGQPAGADVGPGQHRQAVMTDASVAGARSTNQLWHQVALPGRGRPAALCLVQCRKTVDGAGAGNSGTHCSDYIVRLGHPACSLSPEKMFMVSISPPKAWPAVMTGKAPHFFKIAVLRLKAAGNAPIGNYIDYVGGRTKCFIARAKGATML